jgi:uncharacterized protein YraI
MKRVLVAAALATAVGAGAATAAPAIVTTDLNVRAGQGTSHPVVGVLPEGTVVETRGCGDGWCFIPQLGGYASASYLEPAGRRAPRVERYEPYAGPMAGDPVWRDGFYDEPYVRGGGIGFSFGTPGVHVGGWRY